MGSAVPDCGGGERSCVRDAVKSSYDDELLLLVSEAANGKYRQRGP